MAKISKEDIKHVAELARLEISEKEIPKFTQELGAILDYVSELGQAPTKDVEPISQISNLENITRDDKITKSLPREDLLENAPDQKDGFIKVKKIFE